MSYIVMRPMVAWTDPETVGRKSPQFKADYDSTLRLLRTEADLLDADAIIVQVVCDEADVRLDGALKLRANVRHPGVAVSMDTKHGPLRIATDAFETYWGSKPSWQANLRAIALGLTGLRQLDRYGISRRGEQYTGWNQLPAGRPMPSAMTFADAVAILGLAGGSWTGAADVEEAYRRQARAAHPDTGGSTEAFQALGTARDTLLRSLT